MISWVCPECGLDYGTVSKSDAAVALRSYPRRYAALVRGFDDHEDADALVRRRPEPGVWSALEYTMHLADVLEDLDTTLRRMLVDDSPTITDSMDADAKAVEDRYNDAPVEDALARLRERAERIAGTVEGIAPGDLRRTATFPWGEREVIDIARNAVHEGTHHLRDVGRVLAAVRGRPSGRDD